MSNETHNIVYKITNLSNNKIYIGVHKTNNVDDGYVGSGKVILKAIEKYGIENFNKEILYDFNTYQEALDKEKEIVDDEFLQRKDTYNLRRGGSGGFDYINQHYKSREWRSRGGSASKGKVRLYYEIKRNEKILKYLENPSKCIVCKEVLEYEKRHNKFCGHKCSASFNNPRRKRKYHKYKYEFVCKRSDVLRHEYYKNPKMCKMCNKMIEFDKKCNTFCSKSCKTKYQHILHPRFRYSGREI